ncbi:MAG: DUF721 domain-containing protein [Acidimicrobiia bacterium]|nr:DUF721 domain-containing protein [Acidimicrobiia bacterium]
MSRGRPDDQPRLVVEGLTEVSAELGLSDPRVLATVVGDWASIVGDQIAAHARPRGLRDGQLTVAVDQPGWVTELRYRHEGVLAAVREATGSDAVRSLRIVVNPAP